MITVLSGSHLHLLSRISCAVLLLAAMEGVGHGADELSSDLPQLSSGAAYRTPRAGEGFRTEVLGYDVRVMPRDRRTTAAWDLSLALYDPAPEDQELVPIGVVNFWDHKEEGSLLRAQVSVVYNDIFWSSPMARPGPAEKVLVLESFTVPVVQADLVDGRAMDREELLWGYVRPGFGLGLRRNVAPGHEDNMAAVDFTLEPGYLYFRKGSDTSPDFVVPRNVFLARAHLQFRYDGLERNLLELPHEGIAAGFDLISGHRFNWQSWGTLAREDTGMGRNYTSCTGYFLAAGGIPGIESDRHRLIGVLHGGTGHHLDRFSARRIGGGPNPMGEEYGITHDPVLPGAAVQEFFPEHYLLLTAEYRWEAAFFAYLGINATVARLDRVRTTPAGFVSRTDGFRSVGARVTSGFLFQTRLQLAYNYNYDVVRKGAYGGHEVVVSVARSF